GIRSFHRVIDAITDQLAAPAPTVDVDARRRGLERYLATVRQEAPDDPMIAHLEAELAELGYPAVNLERN
ncbi:MAG: hypothetical protein KGR26_11265, partial [Cyanobacteria bacterium REEB65]|nr:hypothetical protein [Cyanobacteria bacterium REEB65]